MSLRPDLEPLATPEYDVQHFLSGDMFGTTTHHVCRVCGSLVHPGCLDRHTNWHALLLASLNLVLRHDDAGAGGSL